MPRMPDPAYAVMQGFTLFHPVGSAAKLASTVQNGRIDLTGVLACCMLVTLPGALIT